MTDVLADKAKEPGEARCPAPSVQEYYAQDTRGVPPALLYDRNDYLGSEDIDIQCYLSPEYAKLEMEKVFKKVWQFACREEQIPEVGDHELYEIGDESLIVVRTKPDEIRAFVNVCLHRGRKLRSEGGRVPEFRCPFHGFTWRLDGSMKPLPCKWDFPHVDEEKFALPEAKVATWRGFVMINFDQFAEPFSDFIGNLDETFIWPLEDRYTAAHVAKRLQCNWKIAQEAFLESWHTFTTHPQLLLTLADENTQYDATVDQPNWSRMLTMLGTPSPWVAEDVTPEEVLEAYYYTRSYYGANPGRDLANAGDQVVEIPQGHTVRDILAEKMRAQLTEATGDDYSRVSDAEMLDAMHYWVFPNFQPWGGIRGTLTYRFRPEGLNPDSCIAEMMILAQPPLDGPKPPPAKVQWLGDDDLFADAPGMGLVGAVFDQDCANLPYVQEGLKAMRKPGITLGNYQESRIRHFHRTLDKWMAK